MRCRIQWRLEKQKYILWISESRREAIKKWSYTVTFHASVPALDPEVTFVPGQLSSCPLHAHESHVDSKQWPSNFRKCGILCDHLILFHTDTLTPHSSLLPPPAPVLSSLSHFSVPTAQVAYGFSLAFPHLFCVPFTPWIVSSFTNNLLVRYPPRPSLNSFILIKPSLVPQPKSSVFLFAHPALYLHL